MLKVSQWKGLSGEKLHFSFSSPDNAQSEFDNGANCRRIVEEAVGSISLNVLVQRQDSCLSGLIRISALEQRA